MVKTVSAAKVTMAEAVDVMVGADKSELVLELNERDDSADPIPRGVIDVAASDPNLGAGPRGVIDVAASE